MLKGPWENTGIYTYRADQRLVYSVSIMVLNITHKN